MADKKRKEKLLLAIANMEQARRCLHSAEVFCLNSRARVNNGVRLSPDESDWEDFGDTFCELMEEISDLQWAIDQLSKEVEDGE